MAGLSRGLIPPSEFPTLSQLGSFRPTHYLLWGGIKQHPCLAADFVQIIRDLYLIIME